ncbi:hypothetical protein [uncultured Cyclobacterium sp.]|uniref:hypothetical protein n=1 Tax=uncultured Cyclobacterium sp. TaxID=453820 RepID=UPI0030EF8A1A|tara:strand:+ start:279 stop:731 length:453 start_codon:yes stop_codon:yes gene_type:complete
MSFNELNSVEYYIIHLLSGLNLNTGNFSEPVSTYGTQWIYKSPNDLNRSVNEVLLEQDLKDALIRLNPEITLNSELADEVIYKLRAILISVSQTGLVKANEAFFKWLAGEKTMPFGGNNRHVPIRIIDFDDIKKQHIHRNQSIPGTSSGD